MSGTFIDLGADPYDAPPKNRPDGPSPRPRDAATLILVRGRREVLMGQRAKGHVFMPDKWVFPGGRVDPVDGRAPAAAELTPETEALLRLRGAKRAPRAYAMAAVRETREEAGLIVGGEFGPELNKLTLICRAITPPLRPRRFDARFFLADAEEVLSGGPPEAADDELLHTRWFSWEEAEALDLARITRFVVGEVRQRLSGAVQPPAFLRWHKGGHFLERLELNHSPVGD